MTYLPNRHFVLWPEIQYWWTRFLDEKSLAPWAWTKPDQRVGSFGQTRHLLQRRQHCRKQQDLKTEKWWITSCLTSCAKQMVQNGETRKKASTRQSTIVTTTRRVWINSSKKNFKQHWDLLSTTEQTRLKLNVFSLARLNGYEV